MHSGEKPNKCDQCEGKSGCQSHQTPQESATADVPRISVYCLSASLSDSVILVTCLVTMLKVAPNTAAAVPSIVQKVTWFLLVSSVILRMRFSPQNLVLLIQYLMLLKWFWWRLHHQQRALLSQWVKLLSDFGDSFCPVTLVSQLVLWLSHRP